MRFPILTKAVAIGLVMLLLAAVMSRIDSLVRERRGYEWQAAASVEQSMAGAQTLLGPWLTRRCTESWQVETGEGRDRRKETTTREHQLDLAAAVLDVDAELRSEARYRGLFKVNGWAGPVVLQAQWPALAGLTPKRERADSQLACDPVRLVLSVSDVRGLRSAQVAIDGQTLAVQPGTGHPRFGRGLHVELPARAESASAALAVRVALDFLGTARISLVPAAGETRWTLRSDWAHPSFIGRFLPTAREVGERGFSARWTVSSLASAAALDLVRDGQLCEASGAGAGLESGVAVVPTPGEASARCLDRLGVAFIDPVNPYVLTDRATKYALLFIVLTFVCVALTEVLARRPVHPVQYALVGLALALFYLLLLSLSEHIGFGPAYAAASAACVLLLSHYGAHMLGGWKAGLAFGGGIALLYGALWVLLQREQTALVIGSLLLFAVLAAVMILTRRLDWDALFGSLRRPRADNAA